MSCDKSNGPNGPNGPFLIHISLLINGLRDLPSADFPLLDAKTPEANGERNVQLLSEDALARP